MPVLPMSGQLSLKSCELNILGIFAEQVAHLERFL